MFDLLIQNGTVIDGTGAARRRADVGVAAGRVTTIGTLDAAQARRTIDARGLAVAPGFVDVHTYADGWLSVMSNYLPGTSQGITTQVLMSDGISYAPVTPENYRDWFAYLRALDGLRQRDYQGWRTIADYLALVDRRTAQNSIAQIPYANLRVLAAGWRRGPLDDTEKKLIRREIEQAMDAGAVGLSTGLDYVAQCFATTDELVDACAAMRPWRGIYATHVRYKIGTLGGVREAVEIGRRAGVGVHISHLKAGTAREVDEILEYVDRVAVHEVDFSFDIYPYLAGSTMVHYLLPYEVWEDGPLAVVARLRDPAVRQRFASLLASFAVPLDGVRLAWTATRASVEFVGLSIAEIAARENKRPAEAMCDLLIEEQLAALCVLEAADDALVEPFLAHDKFMLGTDGIYCPEGRIHPRAYGSTARMLGPLARDRKLFSLEDAVRKMTSVPAERFGLIDRGIVRDGAVADLVIFNPETIADRATYDSPHQLSVGIEHVLVGGVEVFRQGLPIDSRGPELPGRALRFNVSG